MATVNAKGRGLQQPEDLAFEAGGRGAMIERHYARYGVDLERFVSGVVRDAELARDIVQTVFAKAVKDLTNIKEEALRAWLYRVALNEALAQRRRGAVHEKVLRSLAWIRPRPDPTPAETAARREAVERLQQALADLPKEQRQVVALRIHDDLSFAAIAERLGLPLGTVLSRMRRALERLRDTLKEGHP